MTPCTDRVLNIKRILIDAYSTKLCKFHRSDRNHNNFIDFYHVNLLLRYDDDGTASMNKVHIVTLLWYDAYILLATQSAPIPYRCTFIVFFLFLQDCEYEQLNIQAFCLFLSAYSGDHLNKNVFMNFMNSSFLLCHHN